jgi:ABC-type uncharacterized transport system substrate-binding protein
MEFENRIKKEMTEGIVRALLDDACYCAIEYGMEKTGFVFHTSRPNCNRTLTRPPVT